MISSGRSWRNRERNRMPAPLEHVSVLVTRPAHQARDVCALLSNAGATVYSFPAMAIRPVKPDRHVRRCLDALPAQDLLVFTSPNAVTEFSTLLERTGKPLPRDTPCAAIGRRTGEQLRGLGMGRVIVAPPPYDSEALLADPEMQAIRGRRAMLVTGRGGRGMLRRVMASRGATVSVLEVYRRVLPEADPAPLRRWLDRGDVDVILVTSAESLDNLMVLSDDDRRPALLATGLVTVSARIAEAARRRGFHGEIVVTEPGDTALVQGVVRWAERAMKRETDD